MTRTKLIIGAFALVAVCTLLTQTREEIGERDRRLRAETPHKAARIMTLPAPKLVAILGDPAASDFEKAKACQRLGVVGDKSSVLAVAALLPHPTLSHYARTALETTPGPEADKALRDALPKLEGNLLIGAINSIAVRQDPDALDALAKLRQHSDPEVAEAAWQALRAIRAP